MTPFDAFPASPLLAARGISLRPATIADECFMEATYIETRHPAMLATGWPDTLLRGVLRDQYRLQALHYRTYYSDAARLVVECEGQAAGKLLLRNGEEDIRIIDIALSQPFRGGGVGSTLIAWVQDIARARGIGVNLHVDPTNPARRLYLRMGFRVVGQHGADECMRWNAAPPD